MSENPTTPEPPAPPADATPPAPPAGDESALGEAGKRALQAERDARSAAEKRASEAEAQVQKFKDANLTDQQRLEKERDDAKSVASSAQLTLARYEAAEKAGIPLSWAKRLVGATPDELVADAKAVKAELDSKSTGRKPAPDPSQGGAGGTGGSARSVSAGRDMFAAARGKS
jgi:hypothetical protein